MRKKGNRAHTLNQEILKKADLALQALRGNEKPSMVKVSLDQPFKMMKELNIKYSQVIDQQELKNNECVRVQLLPEREQFFYVKVKEIGFPIYVHLKNVSSSAILFVGYNRQFPGVQLPRKKPFYHFCFEFEKDRNISLQNPERINVRVICFTFVSRKKIANLQFQVSFEDQGSLTQKNEYKEYFGKKFILPSVSQKAIKYSAARDVSPSPKMDRRIESSLVESKVISRSFNLISLSLQKARINYDHIQEQKEKNRELKNSAHECKGIIKNYKQTYILDQKKGTKINRYIAPWILCCIFAQKARIKYHKKVLLLQQGFSVNILVHKFIKKIKNNYRQAITLFPNQKMRNKTGFFNFAQLQAKFVYETSLQKADKKIFTFLQSLKPNLAASQLVNKSASYIEKIRKIQKWWSKKYKSRVMMLKSYTERHTIKMTETHRHLREHEERFFQDKIDKKLIWEYMGDECMKLRKRYKKYKEKLLQIKMYEKENQEREKNSPFKKKTSSMKNIRRKKKEEEEKKAFKIPQKPTKPIYLFFTNLDVLKSMIRGWFQLEHKKSLKRRGLI